MVRLAEVINELRSRFHDSIVDPNSQRRNDNKPWVFTHEPNTALTPTVQLFEVDSTFDNRSVGTVGQFERGRIQATVRLKVNAEYDFDTDDELETASDGLNWLVNELIETVISQHSDVVDGVNGLYYVLPDISSSVQERGQTLEKSVDFIAFMERG